tara:strand:- start:629 stop:916 length:288 start_codon:yes stop_codon:yes gene_type:complete
MTATTSALYRALSHRADVQPLSASRLLLSAEALRWFLRQPGTKVSVLCLHDRLVDATKSSVLDAIADFTGMDDVWGDPTHFTVDTSNTEPRAFIS